MLDFIDLKTTLVILHVIGVAIGAGGALMSDLLFFRAMRDKKISEEEIGFLILAGRFVFLGLFVLIASGVGIFLTDPEAYLASTKFLAKMTIVGIITINGLVLHRRHLPWLADQHGKALHLHERFQNKRRTMLISGAISFTSWISAIVLGSLRSVPYSYFSIMTVYAVAVTLALCIALIMRNTFIPARKQG